MIAEKYRFHGHGSLQYLYKRGKIVRSNRISLKFCPNTHRSDYRLAVVVSKKVSKSAVVRNRIRRRVYEITRLSVDEFLANYDMTFLVYDEHLATQSYISLQLEIKSLLEKAAIINRPTSSRAIVNEKE